VLLFQQSSCLTPRLKRRHREAGRGRRREEDEDSLQAGTVNTKGKRSFQTGGHNHCFKDETHHRKNYKQAVWLLENLLLHPLRSATSCWLTLLIARLLYANLTYQQPTQLSFTTITMLFRPGIPNPRAAARYRSTAWLKPGRRKKVNKKSFNFFFFFNQSEKYIILKKDRIHPCVRLSRVQES